MADWINENIEPGKSIALTEVGMLSYLTHSKYKMIDLYCIINKALPNGSCETEEMVNYHKPDYIIHHRKIPRDNYELMHVFINDEFFNFGVEKRS